MGRKDLAHSTIVPFDTIVGAGQVKIERDDEREENTIDPER